MNPAFNKQLTPHFNLREFLRSQTAVRMGISMEPTPAIVQALTDLAVNVLEPFRQYIALPMVISSGYRPPMVNAAIGGSARSQHMLGQACDFHIEGLEPIDVCLALEQCANEGMLKFDQLILEYDAWTHVSYSTRVRGEFLVKRHGEPYLPFHGSDAAKGHEA